MNAGRSENLIRVMIVDDHSIVRTGLVALIEMEQTMTVIAKAADGEEAVDLYWQHQPDITVMDLRLPKISGVDAIKQIRLRNPAAKFIVLTTYDGDEDIFRALRAGADGYLLKGMFDEELLLAIKTVYGGGQHIPPQIKERLGNRPYKLELTLRETQVLELVVKGKSNKEIALALKISEGTVKWFINNIFIKLAARDRAQAISIALRRGIVHL